MVSSCIRPLIQKCEVIKSVPWGPHNSVKLVLNIDFVSVLSRQLVGKISRRSHHKVGATLEGSDADLLEEADPTLWEAARLKCTFEGSKPRCSVRQEPLRRPVPNTQLLSVLWKSPMSWVTLWKLGATPQLNTGLLQEEWANSRCQGISYEASSG